MNHPSRPRSLRRLFHIGTVVLVAGAVFYNVFTQPGTARADEETNTPTPTPCVTRTPGPTPTPDGLGGGNPDHGFC